MWLYHFAVVFGTMHAIWPEQLWVRKPPFQTKSAYNMATPMVYTRMKGFFPPSRTLLVQAEGAFFVSLWPSDVRAAANTPRAPVMQIKEPILCDFRKCVLSRRITFTKKGNAARGTLLWQLWLLLTLNLKKVFRIRAHILQKTKRAVESFNQCCVLLPFIRPSMFVFVSVWYSSRWLESRPRFRSHPEAHSFTILYTCFVCVRLHRKPAVPQKTKKLKYQLTTLLPRRQVWSLPSNYEGPGSANKRFRWEELEVWKQSSLMTQKVNGKQELVWK